MFEKKTQHYNYVCLAKYTVVRLVYEFYLHKFTYKTVKIRAWEFDICL